MSPIALASLLALEPSAPAGLPAPVAPAAAEAPAPALWAGHIVVRGRRVLPFFGDLKPQNDTFVLAEVTPTEGGYTLVQRPCRTEVAPIAGASVRFLPGADERLPVAEIRFEAVDGALVATGWENGWDDEDLDGDGHPGVTVIVDAPMCGGALYVASHTRSEGAAQRDGGALRGEVQVTVEQRILGAHGACLRLVAQDSRDGMAGRFAYTPVSPGTTCQDLSGAWPVHAE